MQRALQSVPGVRTVEVSFKNKTATVAFDSDRVKAAQLIDALTKAGFGGRVKDVAD